MNDNLERLEQGFAHARRLSWLANRSVGLFGDHPRVWHPLKGETIGTRETYCGLWPDTFAQYGAAKDALPECKRCIAATED